MYFASHGRCSPIRMLVGLVSYVQGAGRRIRGDPVDQDTPIGLRVVRRGSTLPHVILIHSYQDNCQACGPCVLSFVSNVAEFGVGLE